METSRILPVVVAVVRSSLQTEETLSFSDNREEFLKKQKNCALVLSFFDFSLSREHRRSKCSEFCGKLFRCQTVREILYLILVEQCFGYFLFY